MMQLSSIDAQNLRLMAFDVDGVMTDGRIYFSPEGEAIKAFNTLDGHGLKKLAASGVILAIITGRNTPMVAKRAADLGIAHVIQGREDKGVALAALAEQLGMAASETGYAGDDEPDVSALHWAQLSFAPANAHDCAKSAADHITERRGGEGAVREICDAIAAQRSPA